MYACSSDLNWLSEPFSSRVDIHHFATCRQRTLNISTPCLADRKSTVCACVSRHQAAFRCEFTVTSTGIIVPIALQVPAPLP
jgi:hypothetical protein